MKGTNSVKERNKKEQLYELFWEVETDTLSFPYREFKIFTSEVGVKRYGKRREVELNRGVPLEERAHNGYYFKYRGALRVKEIDGFVVKLIRR